LKVLKQSTLGQMTFNPSPYRPSAATLKHRPDKKGCLGLLLGLTQPTPPQPAPGPTPSPVPGEILGVIGLTLSPGVLGPLTFRLDLDAREQPGNVQVLSLVQFNPSGGVMGGIRVLGVAI
jgi:hypothetical protein